MSIPNSFNPMGTLGRELPPGYKRLNYLEGTGSQYIKTGKSPTIGTRWVVDASFESRSSHSAMGYYVPGAPRFEVDKSSTGSGAIFKDTYYVQVGGNSALYLGAFPAGGRAVFVIDVPRKTVAINEIQEIIEDVSFIDRELFLFRRNSDSISSAGNGPCKLWRSTLWEFGVKVQDLVPALREVDNRPGLLDLVGKNFLTNDGTGEFLYEL